MPEVWVNQSRDEVQAGNGLVTIAFARRGKAVVMRSLARGARRVELLAEPRDDDHLWEMELRTAKGETVAVSSADAPAATMEARIVKGDGATGKAAEITLRWPDGPVAHGRIDVEATVRVDRGDPVTHWRLTVANPQQELGPWRVTFPIIPNVSAQPRSKLAFPMGWGLVFADPLHAGEVRGVYPGMAPAMQFMACWRAGGGVYLGAHDPAATYKQFVETPRAEEERLRLAIVDYPAGMGQPAREYALPYQAAVGVFAGDWYDAAQLHRQWVISAAPWASQGEERTRQAAPQWLKEIDLWCVGGGSAAEAVEPVKRFAAYFGVPTAVHWYSWHQIPFDDHYPEYFPAKPGFAEGVAALQAAGVRVMPYINGRLWDPRTDSWKAENAEAACAKDESLHRYEETYGSGVPLVVMCPYTEQWQAKVTGLVDRLVRECGVDGVYIDQISAASAVLCFDKEHGHPVGGGGLWAAGYRRLLERARANLPPGRMLTTEENADPWVDLLDAFLLVNTPPNRGEVTPLYPAVYGGRTITFGFQYIAGGDLDNGLPFRAKMARAFAWGSQLGWVGPEILQERYAREAEYLRALAQCRHRAHDFLAFGEMLKPPQVRGVARVTIAGKAPFGGEYGLALPAVVSSAWRADNGDIGIALTNFTDEQQTARLDLSARRLGLAAGGRYRLTRIAPQGEQAAVELAGPRLAHEEIMPPRSAVVLRISAFSGG